MKISDEDAAEEEGDVSEEEGQDTVMPCIEGQTQITRFFGNNQNAPLGSTQQLATAADSRDHKISG